MGQVYLRTVAVAAEFAPLESSRTVVSVAITCPSTNEDAVTFEDAAGNEAAWEPGETHTFSQIDLATVQVKGSVGDVVTVNGHDGPVGFVGPAGPAGPQGSTGEPGAVNEFAEAMDQGVSTTSGPTFMTLSLADGLTSALRLQPVTMDEGSQVQIVGGANGSGGVILTTGNLDECFTTSFYGLSATITNSISSDLNSAGFIQGESDPVFSSWHNAGNPLLTSLLVDELTVDPGTEYASGQHSRIAVQAYDSGVQTNRLKINVAGLPSGTTRPDGLEVGDLWINTTTGAVCVAST
jgi:hypothetical protein